MKFFFYLFFYIAPFQLAAKKNNYQIVNFLLLHSTNIIRPITFFECEKLKEITIPDSFTAINEYAFYGCSSLARISISSSVTAIKKICF